MPRLRNDKTGVVVNVDDATAGRLGGDWSPVEQSKQATKKTASKPSGK